MAEVVQRHLEEMLPEFEQAKKIGLFSESEIKYVRIVSPRTGDLHRFDFDRKIVRTRRRHEYKIIRRTKEKECYLDYIKYETHLLKLVQLRREVQRNLLQRDEISTSSSRN